MATTAAPAPVSEIETTTEAPGFRSVPEFEGVRKVWPRGARLEAIREAARAFSERFAAGPTVEAVRTFDLAAGAYHTRFAFGGAVSVPVPYVFILNRLVVVQYRDFEGALRTLVWEPLVPEGTAEAPYYAQALAKYGEFLGNKVFSKRFNTVPEALTSCGLRPEDVDYGSYDHLHVQDPRWLMGTTEPVMGEAASREPMLPNTTFISQRLEVDTFRSPHPMQWAWYVEGGLDKAKPGHHVEIEGDVELGEGVAILHTPGHTDGNQSLCVNTPTGVWVSSENGVAIDNWQPELSKIPGVRKEAEFFGREVVLNSNTLEDSIDQYDSMVKEKTVATPSRADPRFRNVLPSSELPRWKRHWPVWPTHLHGEIPACGTFARSPDA